MITLDSIGTGPTKVWASRSDKFAVNLLGGTAHALNLPIGIMNVDGFRESDEVPFIRKRAKTITIHSLTPVTSHILHTAEELLTQSVFTTTTTPTNYWLVT